MQRYDVFVNFINAVNSYNESNINMNTVLEQELLFISFSLMPLLSETARNPNVFVGTGNASLFSMNCGVARRYAS